MKKTPEQIKEDLMQFTGTEHYYKHPMSNAVFTSGILAMAELCEAHWLISACMSWQFEKIVSEQEFQVFNLKVNTDKSAVLNIEDGNYNIIATQEIEFTDFPLDSIELWFSNNVLYLPSEH